MAHWRRHPERPHGTWLKNVISDLFWCGATWGIWCSWEPIFLEAVGFPQLYAVMVVHADSGLDWILQKHFVMPKWKMQFHAQWTYNIVVIHIIHCILTHIYRLLVVVRLPCIISSLFTVINKCLYGVFTSVCVCVYIYVVARSNLCKNVVLGGCEVRFPTSSQLGPRKWMLRWPMM